MFRSVIKLFLFTFCLFSSFAFAKNILITELTKSANKEWVLEYHSKTPISSIQFAITPDDSRHSRWKLLTEGFEFHHLGGKDSVFRRDGKPFYQVRFALTPTYIHLPKQYAPFSPFSDGSMLFHSARFFACPELCSGIENLWYLKLNAPKSEIILLNGQQASGQVSWYDNNDGRKVFVGTLSPENFNGLLAIIDPAIPSEIKRPLQLFLPQAIAFLSSKLQPLSSKPMLFTSFGKTTDGRYGRQGGVLPEQMFMHWYGQIPETVPYDLLWFFAHEAAHLFQHVEGMKIEAKDAWIHEGHAEFVASRLLLNFYPEAKGFVNSRIQAANDKCVAMLKEMPLEKFAENGRFKSLYDCGLHFFATAARANGNGDNIAFGFWKTLGQQDAGANINKQLIRTTLAKFVATESAAAIAKEMGWQH